MIGRAPSGAVLVGSIFGFACVCVVSCGSSDSSKHPRGQPGGEGGAAQAGEGPSGGGRPGGGTSGHGGNAGSGGTRPAGPGGAAGAESGGDGGSPPSVPEGGAGASGAADAGGAAGATNVAGASGDEGAGCLPSPASRITIGFDALNAERVTNLQWLDNGDSTIANVAASGGPETCGDPVEYFGESYGAPESTTPLPVIAGSRSTSITCGPDITITAAPKDCNDQPQTPVTTEYHFYGGAKASQMRVTRTLGFDQNTPKFSGVGVRVWQPRVFNSTFVDVIYPNQAETAVTSTPAASCGNDCLMAVGPTWSGRWFADVAQDGLALIVLRDPNHNDPVDLTINSDAYSSANLSSFVMLQPPDGWKAPLTDAYYVCFADLTSWPKTDRDAARLPAFCGP